MCTVYEVGTVKEVALDGGASRTYVSVDGGMSDNIRTALYDADYSCTLASRRSRRSACAVAGRRQALRGRRHRGQGRVPARRRPPRRPPRGPRHRRLLPLDGLQLQPRTPPAGHRRARRPVPRRRTPRDARRPARHRCGWASGHHREVVGRGPCSGCVHRKAPERCSTCSSSERRQRGEVRARGRDTRRIPGGEH